MLSAAAGQRIRYVPISAEEARRQALDAGQPEAYLEIGANMDTFGRKDGFARITTEFEALTGQKPIPFPQFAADYADSFKRN